MYNKEEVDGIINFFLHCYKINKKNNIPKFPLAITLKLDKKIIGNVGIGKYSLDNSKTEIFYFINSQYWNNGYVSEAVSVFIEYIKKHKIVTTLIGALLPSNIASIKILEKNGFSQINHTYADSRNI